MGFVTDFTREVGITSDFESQGGNIDESAFSDPSLAANKEDLKKRIAAVEARKAAQAAGVEVGAVQLGQATQAQGPNFGTGFRSTQQSLATSLQDRIAGRGPPSAAELQSNRERDENVRRSIAGAASVRGNVNPALLARLTQRQIATTNQDASGRAAILRAEDTATSQGILAGLATAGREGDVGQAGIEQQTEIANLRARQEIALKSGDIQLARELEQARLNLETQQTNVQAQLQQQQLNDQLVAQFVANGLSLDQAQFAAQQELQRLKVDEALGLQGLDAATAQANAAATGNVVGAIAGGVGAAIASDREQKKNIKPGSKDVARLMDRLSKEGEKQVVLKKDASGTYAFLDKLKPYSFEYKDPTIPGAAPGRHTGVMAQDVQKSLLGKDMVIETPTGKKLEIIKGFNALMAASAEFHDRIKSLERKAA